MPVTVGLWRRGLHEAFIGHHASEREQRGRSADGAASTRLERRVPAPLIGGPAFPDRAHAPTETTSAPGRR
jgi:hypothetical protein